MNKKRLVLISAAVLLCVLVCVSVFQVDTLQTTFRTQKAMSGLQGCAESIELYEAARGQYPNSIAELLAIDPITLQPFSRVEWWGDPWGNQYLYRTNDLGFTVSSAGPDGRHGTGDDLQLQRQGATSLGD